MARPQSNTSALLFIVLGLSFWAAFQIVGLAHHGYALGLGSTEFPAREFVIFARHYALLGGAGAILIALGATRWGSLPPMDQARWFLPVATALGIAIPAAIRCLVLDGGAVTDDEAVYGFSAQLLASGRLTAPSHPLKLFFDHAFIVNDGRMFSQYFLGWPAIMALGVPFGATGYVNALVSGATVPALYQLLKTTVGVAWARLGVLVFLTSPMIQIAAATEMSHTSTLGALVYAMWFANLALRDGGSAHAFRLRAIARDCFRHSTSFRDSSRIAVGPGLVAAADFEASLRQHSLVRPSNDRAGYALSPDQRGAHGIPVRDGVSACLRVRHRERSSLLPCPGLSGGWRADAQSAEAIWSLRHGWRGPAAAQPVAVRLASFFRVPAVRHRCSASLAVVGPA